MSEHKTQAQSLTCEEFLERIKTRSATIGIVGLGYVGLPLVLMFADAGFRITGFDIDSEKVDALNEGRSYIHRIEPSHILTALAAGFKATSDYSLASQLDALLICVPTPLHADHTPNMDYVCSTIDSLAPHLHAGQLVVLESTTYPGTTEEIIVPAIERGGNRVLRSRGSEKGDAAASRGLDGVLVAFSPEREDPGNTTTARHAIPKVVGGINKVATEISCALYGSIFDRTIPMSSTATAEMTKLLENIFRSVNIALVNQMKMTCIGMGIDIWEVIDAAATKPFGFMPFYPGPGVGGHCIPVDPFYLTWKAKQFGLSTPFIELAGRTNEAMPHYIVGVIKRELGRSGVALSQAKILTLGVAYKRDVDDLRESPSLDIIGLMKNGGAEVSYNDPFFPTVGSGRHYDLRMTSTPVENLDQYDCVVILTDHSAYNVRQIVDQARLIIDTRNATRGISSTKVVKC